MNHVYIVSELVIEYINLNGLIEKTRTNRICEKIFDSETLNKQIEEKNIIIFENENWINRSYKKKFKYQIISICPNMQKLIKVHQTCCLYKHY
jgi:hypothetical protein